MAELQIDRLSLSLPSSSPERGERLARRIADGLAGWVSDSGSSVEINGLDLNLLGTDDEDDEILAGRIVTALLQLLDTTS